MQELARYRSDFFGRLRQILGDRPDIRTVGDRFVFQSEVLFDTGKAELNPEGKTELDKLADAVVELDKEIPPEIPWVLRVDGHTDKRPIQSTRIPFELGFVGLPRHRRRAISRQQGRAPRPARRRGLRRIPADRSRRQR